jgi:hypothetical protein
MASIGAMRRLHRTSRHLAPPTRRPYRWLSADATAPAWQPPLQHVAPDDEEWRLRQELACAYRWADRHKLSEGVCNHFTAEVTPGKFLVIPYGMQWAEVTAASLLLVDDRGTVLRGGGSELAMAVDVMTGKLPPTPDGFDKTGMLEPTAFYIHSSIHKVLGKRGRVVLHTHMPFATAMACTTPRPGEDGPPPNRLAYVPGLITQGSLCTPGTLSRPSITHWKPFWDPLMFTSVIFG